MKKILLYAIPYMLYAICYLHPQQPTERVLTVEESVGLVISNSQQLLSAAQDIQIAKQRLKEAKSIMYPQL